MDTTLPVPEPIMAELTQEPINRLADALMILQEKPTLLTVTPVMTLAMTFDGKSETFHTMTKMQPTLIERMKINTFHIVFRNINSINRQTLDDVLAHFTPETCQAGTARHSKTHVAPTGIRSIFLTHCLTLGPNHHFCLRID